jgi:predicted DNA-binding WGR domain protein
VDTLAASPVQLLVLERVEGAEHMARYYVLSIEPTLFGDAALVREWGRIGHGRKRRLDLYADNRQAAVALTIWLARKMKRSYAPRARTTAPTSTLSEPSPKQSPQPASRAALPSCCSTSL